MNNILAKLMPDPMDKESVKRQGWEEQRILVVCADDPRLSPIERAFVEQLAKRLYRAELQK